MEGNEIKLPYKLTQKQVDKLLKLADHYELKMRWRSGQSFFNALYELHPDIANAVRATVYDTYHVSNKIEKCLDFISED